MVPSIFCCQKCVCKDNDIDIMFDFDSDNEDTHENKPLLGKKHTKTSSKNITCFYFYFKDDACSVSTKDTLAVEKIIEAAKCLPIGQIDSITVFTSQHHLSYIKIKYLKINKRFMDYYANSPTSELITGIRINRDTTDEKYSLPKPLQGEQLSRFLGNVIYSIDYCSPTDLVLWISHKKPFANSNPKNERTAEPTNKNPEIYGYGKKSNVIVL